MLDLEVDSRFANRDVALDYYQRRELDLLQKVDELQLENAYLRNQLDSSDDDTGTFAAVSEG